MWRKVAVCQKNKETGSGITVGFVASSAGGASGVPGSLPLTPNSRPVRDSSKEVQIV